MEPKLGQGAGLAIEDAVVLAYAVADASSVVTGVAHYDRSRTGRVTPLARQSRLLGRLTKPFRCRVSAAQQHHPPHS